MRLLLRTALVAAGIVLLADAPSPSLRSEEAAHVLALSGQRIAGVQSYTSKLHVDFALRSFPFARFHLDGNIAFRRPNLYSVHFDRVPWFGKGFENMRMDPLVPSMWPEHYDVTNATRIGERIHFEMRDKVAGNIKGVHAEVDPDGLRAIEWAYTNGGRIVVQVTPQTIDGVPVPAAEDAEIKLPAYHVVAHATFSDYKIVTDGPEGTHVR